MPYAIEAENSTGMPAVAILAQAALESGWGKYAHGNMYFGIKAKNWTGKKQLITTTEYHKTDTVKYPEIISITKLPNGKFKYRVKDWFRAYDSPADSFADHANLIVKVPRYAKAVEHNDDAMRFVEEIAKAGYATDPNYVEKLKSLIVTIKKANELV